jgi:hypothetical protein
MRFIRLLAFVALCPALVLAGLAGCGLDKKEGQSQQQAQQVAQNFVENEATFKFDGMIETLKMTENTVLSDGYEFVFEFESSHAGYGDRTDRVLAQVITPHQDSIVVKQGRVFSAVMDVKWDMMKQQFLPDYVPE